MSEKSLGQIARERYQRKKKRERLGGILKLWRRCDSKVMVDDPVAVSSIVGRVVNRLGLEDQLTEQELDSAWKEIVGDFLSAHSRPTAVRRRVLEVSVLQPAVLFTLEREMKPIIARKLRERFGGERIRDIRFRVG
ncbi:MAG: DUF721 domain-containing protein [Verrucomicrobiota bacterium]